MRRVSAVATLPLSPLPAFSFNPVFRPIDGGPTFYNDNGFSVAVAAGYDNSSYYPIGCWPSYLETTVEYSFFQGIGFNVAMLLITPGVGEAGCDQTLAGSSPYGVYWWPDLEFAASQPFITAAGPESPVFNVFDEAGNWVNDIGNRMAGTTAGVGLASPTSTTKANGRAHWANLTFHMADQVLAATPSPTTPAAQWSSTVTDRGGATRHVDLTSIDNYWISSTTDMFNTAGLFGIISSYCRLSGAPNGSTNQNIVDPSLPVTVPTSFPTDVPLITSPNRGFQIGQYVLVASSGTTAAFMGTVKSYSTSTGAMTVHVVASQDYTTGVNSAGSLQIFLPAVDQTTGPVAPSADSFIWSANGAGGVVTCVNAPSHIPTAGTTIVALGPVGGNGYGVTCSNAVNCVTGDTIRITSTWGSGTFSGTGTGVHAAPSVDQSRRTIHYGMTTDLMRGYQYGSTPSGSPALPLGAPIGQFLDVLGPYVNQFLAQDYVQPAELAGMAWVHIMHGGRWISWFNSSKSGINTTEKTVQSTYCQTPQGNKYFGGPPNTISTRNQILATNSFIKKMAPVINSPFVMNYATVSPNGFIAPFPSSYAQNPGFAIATYANPNPWYNDDLAVHDGLNVASWEVATKYYTGSTSGVLVANSYYLMIAFRSGRKDSPSLTVTCTIGTPATTVTRIYMDCVIDAGNSIGHPGVRTQIQVASTAQMSDGDTVLIENTNGVSGLNGTFIIPSGGIVDPTHVEIVLVFSGTLVLPRGTILVTHDISVSGSRTFTDTFSDITDVRIYRVN